MGIVRRLYEECGVLAAPRTLSSVRRLFSTSDFTGESAAHLADLLAPRRATSFLALLDDEEDEEQLHQQQQGMKGMKGVRGEGGEGGEGWEEADWLHRAIDIMGLPRDILKAAAAHRLAAR